MKTKKDIEYSFNHTKKRLKQRYDTEITREDYDLLCERVKNDDDTVLITTEFQKNDTQYTYDLQFIRRDDIRVVWSEARQCITTVLER